MPTGPFHLLPPGHDPRGASAGQNPASGTPFGHAYLPGLAGYGPGLGQLGFDRAHAATPQAVQVDAFRAPVQFRQVSGDGGLVAERVQAAAEPAGLPEDPPPGASVADADPTAAEPMVEPAAQAGAAA